GGVAPGKPSRVGGGGRRMVGGGANEGGAIGPGHLFGDAIKGRFDDPTDTCRRPGEAFMMTTARPATADAFARAPLPKRFCNLDRLLHAMKARGLDGIVATAPW